MVQAKMHKLAQHLEQAEAGEKMVGFRAAGR